MGVKKEDIFNTFIQTLRLWVEKDNGNVPTYSKAMLLAAIKHDEKEMGRIGKRWRESLKKIGEIDEKGRGVSKSAKEIVELLEGLNYL